MNKFILIPLLTIATQGCYETNSLTLDQRYQEAVVDALTINTNEISYELTEITPSNTSLTWENGRVLMVTLTGYPESYPVDQTVTTWWGTTWVTAIPDLSQRYFSSMNFQQDEALRIYQILGLPPDTTYVWLAEVWVDPDDLFRPCPDEEITDSTCDTSFPDTASANHIEWFNNQYDEAFNQTPQYPWTRLGYTYYWGYGVDEVGVSEFVIRQNSEVIVKRLEHISNYFSSGSVY